MTTLFSTLIRFRREIPILATSPPVTVTLVVSKLTTLVANSPLLGNGYRSFQVKCHEEQFFIEGKQQCSTHPHNIYAQFLAELGIVGFSFLFDRSRILQSYNP